MVIVPLAVACVPSEPYQGGYVESQSGEITAEVIPCLQKPEGFHSVTLESVIGDGKRDLLWKIEGDSAAPGINFAVVGRPVDKFQTVVPMRQTLRNGVQYDVTFDEGVATSVSFQKEYLKNGFYSLAADTKEELLKLPRSDFAC